MKEVSRQPRSPAILIALLLVVAIVAGIAWVVSSYLRTSGPVKSPVSTQALDANAAAARHDRGNGWGRRAAMQEPLRDWWINTGQYRMDVHQPENSSNYEYHFSIVMTSAFTGQDRRLMILARTLATNTVSAKEAGASEALVKQLNDLLGDRINREPLRVSDELAAPCKDLWTKFVATKGSKEKEAVHDDLVHAIENACNQALKASAPDFAATVAEVRKLIPNDAELEKNLNAARAQQESQGIPALSFMGMGRSPASTRPGAATRPSTRPRPTTRAATRPIPTTHPSTRP